MKFLAYLLFSFHIAAASWATEQPACRTVSWPLSPNASFAEIKVTLDEWPQSKIVQLAWGEMLKKDPSQSVALPVLNYLQITETKSEVKGYYRVMVKIMTHGLTIEEAMSHWPTRPPTYPIGYSLKKLCELRRTAVVATP